MDPRLVAIGLARPIDPTVMDPRLVAIGFVRPIEPAVAAPSTAARVAAPDAAPVAAPSTAAHVAAPVAAPVFAPARQPVQVARPTPLLDPRLVAIGLARPIEPTVAARSTAAPIAAPVAAPSSAARVAAPVAGPVFVPAREAVQVARPPTLLRQAVRVRDGRRDVFGLCELDSAGIRLSGGRPIQIPWPDIRSISVERGLVNVVSSSSSIRMAVALDGVGEPDLAPLFFGVLEEGRAGTLEPRMGALHELTLGIDRTIESFADADDPVVPLAVGAFAAFAAIVLIAALPMIVVLLAHIQSVPLGTFAILPRVASYDPRVIVAAAAAAIALATAVGRFALGPSATVWARGTMRGWHRTAEGFDAAARQMIARLMLTPRIAALVAAIALGTLVPAVFARTTLDSTGIHAGYGLPFISAERSWAELADVTSIAVGFGERVEGFDTQLVFTDGSTLSTRGQDLVGGSERAFYDFAHAHVR